LTAIGRAPDTGAAVMNRTRRPARRNGPWHPRWEGLEARLALSASPPMAGPFAAGAEIALAPQPDALNVVATDPAPGSHPVQSPTELVVTFDRPVASFSVGFGDIELEQVAADGTATPVFDPDSLPTETLDDSGTQLTVALDQPLGAGNYRIVLSGMSSLMGEDGTFLANGGNDQALADFSVGRHESTLVDATDLGTPGSQPAVYTGALDLSNDPADVRLYKLTLPAGHFWQLGLEVSSQRDGGTLNTALALFDSQGRPIATDDIGRADDPFDPYLFAGLTPGTYYVGVSGGGNLPGGPGGYDPVSGQPGAHALAQAGGAYRLHVAADPADAPTSLIGLTIDHADPHDPTPTGLTLQFSGAISLNTASGSLSSQLDGGVQLVDQSGRTWPLESVGYSEGSAQLSLVFRQHLPSGRYYLRLPSQGALTDLTGRPPVAPGQPAGQLGSFYVTPSPTRAPSDFGPLFPLDAASGISRDAVLPPGGSATFHATTVEATLYGLKLDTSGTPVTVTVTAGGVTTTIDPTRAEQGNALLLSLPAGPVTIRVASAGARPSHVTLSLQTFDRPRDSVLLSGVGQGPALNLRLIAPTAMSPATPTDSSAAPVSAPSSPSGPPVGPMPGTTASSGADAPGTPAAPSPAGHEASGGTTTGTTTATVQGPAGLFLAPAVGPVGHPGASAEQIAAVGPASSSEGTALAFGQGDLPRGIRFGTTDGQAAPFEDGRQPDASGSINGAIVEPSEPAAAPAMAAATVPQAPSAAWRWIERLWSGLSVRGQAPVIAQVGPNPTLVAMADASEPAPDQAASDEETTAQASFAPPVGVGLGALVLLGYRHRAATRRRRLRGPHFLASTRAASERLAGRSRARV
jgi:methionine-rich copper-binding protein CopC